jgi:WD40 repeat protein
MLERLSGQRHIEKWRQLLSGHPLAQEPSPEILRCLESQNPLQDLCDTLDARSEDKPEEIRFPGAATAKGPLGQLGAYHVIRALGQGSFGVVFLAYHDSLEHQVALKVLKPTLAANETARALFEREGKAAARIRAPQVVGVHDAGTTPDFPLPYLAMEFVAGESLADHLKRKGPPKPRAAAELLRQVTLGVAAAHGQGVVHGDLKPANILLEEQTGQARITDFGFARAIAAADEQGGASGWTGGTPAYRSPEQITSPQRIEVASDVYSLGVVFYELLTGERPFRAVGPQLRQQVLHEEPRPPRTLNDQIPRDLETICRKALAKEPGRRYQTAHDFAADLQRWLRGEPIQARPVGTAERLWRWCRRNPALAIASGLAALALLTVAVVSTAFALHQARAVARLEETDRRRQEGLRLAAGLALHQGQTWYEQGQAGRGLLWLVRGLQIAPAEAVDVQRTLRLKLGDWQRFVHPLRAICPHDGSAVTGAFSPDGQTVLTASEDGTARLWQTATGQPLGPPFVHRGPIWAVAFSPDGRKVVTASDDQTARLWDVGTGNPVGQPLVHQGPIRAVAFSPDGRTVLTGSHDGTARLWDARTAQPLPRSLPHQGGVHTVAFRPDGQVVLAGGQDGFARMWDAATGKPVGRSLAHEAAVWVGIFSPDGRMVATASEDGTARVWETATGEPRGQPLRHQKPVRAIAFSPDGQTVLTASHDHRAQLWETATGKPRGSPWQHAGALWAAAFSPDGQTILTAGTDQAARLWEASTGKPVGAPLPHQRTVRAAAFSPDGKTLLTVSYDGTARLWDVNPNKLFGKPLPHRGNVRAVAFSPDGRTVFTGSVDGTAQLWQTATGRPLGAPFYHQDSVRAIAFSPDGQTVLTATDQAAQRWDVGTRKPLGRPLAHPGPVCAVGFSPDGQTIVTGGADHTARLWEVNTGRPLGLPLRHHDIVRAAVFSPDGKVLATASQDRTARLWAVRTTEQVGPPLAHQEPVVAVGFSPDGKTLVTASYDRTARLWETATGQPLGLSFQHQAPVRTAAFSPDGEVLVTTSDDGTAQLWETATGQPVCVPLLHRGEVVAAAFSPDGQTLVTGCNDHTARLWRVPGVVEGPVERVQLWTQAITGLELDADGQVRVLNAHSWQQCRRRLEELRGPPSTGNGHDLVPE